ELHTHFYNTLKAQQIDEVSKPAEKLSFDEQCKQAMSAWFDALANGDPNATAKFNELREITREDPNRNIGVDIIRSWTNAGLESRSSHARAAICNRGVEQLSGITGYLPQQMSGILSASVFVSAALANNVDRMKYAAGLLEEHCIAECGPDASTTHVAQKIRG